MTSIVHHPSSYRDPSGFIFEKDGTLYRQVNLVYKEHFEHLINSGCYKHLTGKGLLISHEQIDRNLTGEPHWYTTLQPEKVDFISYPYEWSFDMLKDAALLTLRVATEALKYQMMLRDATPSNIQWHDGKFIFIDTLSFGKYENGPWVAYRQFCETFLGPLLLMHYRKKPLQQLQLSWPDGIPLDIVQSLLPGKSRFSLHTYLHVHLHAKISTSGKKSSQPAQNFSKQKLLRLIASLETLIKGLHLPPKQTVWSSYYEEASGRQDYLENKKAVVKSWTEGLTKISNAADLGSNQGEFTRLLAEKGIKTIATDSDPYVINSVYTSIKTNGEKNILPLIMDLANPSPSIGVNNKERDSFSARVHVDLVLALALIHHLAIGRNIPMDKIAEFLAPMGKCLIIEFVPKEDEKSRLLLENKEDIYDNYTRESFEKAFSKLFTIEKAENIKGSERSIYLLKSNTFGDA